MGAMVGAGGASEEHWLTDARRGDEARCFFGVEIQTDRTGSSLVHTGEWQGKPYEDKGTIVRFEPEELLVHTHWSPLSGLPDRPENYQQVTWRSPNMTEGRN
jgi:hypothetical protein